MMMGSDMSLRLRFGAPRSDWLPLGISSASMAFDAVLSSVPTDPLQGMASAALAATGGRAGSCVLHTEPVEYVLSFLPDPRGVRLEIVRWEDSRREEDGGVRVFQKTGAPEEVLVPVWRGLRELGSRWRGEPERCWKFPFPAGEVAKLGEALGR